MLIFGWGSDRKQLGEVGVIECANCHNARRWIIVEESKKATIYFVRVAKWDKIYALLCPVCNDGVQLESREHAQDLLLEHWEQTQGERNDTLRQLITESRVKKQKES